MLTFLNEYTEPQFFTVAKAEIQKQASPITFARRFITLRRTANRILRVPQRISIHRIGNREAQLNDQEKTTIRLQKNIVTEIRCFKNKQIITVKTDINGRYLKRI